MRTPWAVGVLVLALLVPLGLPSPAEAGPADTVARAEVARGGRQYGWGGMSWTAACTSDNRFRATSASLNVWANGQRINGIRFRYRIVPAGTAGQPQLWINWSPWVTKSFPMNSFWRGRLTAGALDQTRGTLGDWDLEVNVRFNRVNGIDFRHKQRYPITNPSCGISGGT